MPFGIASGPEEYQRRQHEFLDGLNGAINIADDICVYGCGDTMEAKHMKKNTEQTKNETMKKVLISNNQF